jgi:hypothetical protein
MNAKIVYAMLFVTILGIGCCYVFGSDSAKVSKIEAHQQNVNYCMNNPLANRCSN